jgi:hypothetical protein
MIRDISDAEVSEALEHWRQHGFARIPAVALPSTVAALRERLEDLVAGRRPDPGLFFQPDAPTGRYEDVVNEDGWRGPDVAYRKIDRMELDDLFRAWVGNPLFARLCAAVHPGGATLYRAVVFSKAPRLGTALPWHQDGGRLWGLDRNPSLQGWLALDEASEASGCLSFVPGSHAWGLATPMGGLVPGEIAEARDVEPDVVRVPAAPGDVVLVHSLVWHRSGRNLTDAPRRGLTVTFLDAATRCVRKKRAPRVFQPIFPAQDLGPVPSR